MKFKIITAVWNSVAYIEACAASIVNQNVDVEVMIVDDASTDGTTELVQKICNREGWGYVLKDVNTGVPHSHWTAVKESRCHPDDLLVFVDGDDQLAPGALIKLSEHYEDPNLSLTYGQYRSEPFSPSCSLAGPYPPDVIRRRAYREHSLLGRGIPWNHLRTMKHKIFGQLTETDFKFKDGTWYNMSSDAVVMYPALELAGDNFKFIPEVLYIYNSENPLSEWRKAPRDGDKVHQDVLKRDPKCFVEYDSDPNAIMLRHQRGMKR